MIKLVVKPFCHECPNFEAEANRTAMYSGNRLECMSDCIISCKHRILCNRINDYLISKFNEERMKEQKDN